MNKLKDWVNRGKAMLDRAKKGKLTSEDKTNVVAVSVTILFIGALFFLISKFWIPIAAIILFVYINWDKIKPEKPVPPQKDVIVYNTFFSVLHDTHDRIGASRPIDIMDITVMPSIIQKYDIEMVRVKITRTNHHPLSEEDLEIIKKKMQGRINEHLINYKHSGGNQYISPDGNAPIIFIDSVIDNVINYLVDVVYIDSQAKLDYYYKKFGTNKHYHPKGEDRDF